MRYLHFGAAAALSLASCSLAIPQAKERIPQSHPSIGDATTAFAFRLIQKTGSGSDQNYLISPFSVSCALSLLLPGTQGLEQKKLLSSIAPGMNAAQAIYGYGTLSRHMTKGSSLSVANSAWVDSRMKLNAAYAKSIQNGLSARISSFKHNSQSLSAINSWVNTKTRQRIPKILDQIKDADRLFLINAIAFDGTWKIPFDAKLTSQQEFHTSGGSSENVLMMHMKDKIDYFKNDTLRAIRLGYAGGDYSMLLMLPEHGDDAGDLLKSLNGRGLKTILDGASDSDNVRIAVPKFKFSKTYQMKDALSAMGLGSFFQQADFSKISDSLRMAKIDRVIHKTFIEVDEKGTKAAAASAIGIQPTMVRVDAPEFIADRPFAFLILHNPSKVVVFAGVVNRP